MSWTDTNFRKPRTGEKLLKVMWRNGEESRHEYIAAQLRWTDTGHDFDILKVARA